MTTFIEIDPQEIKDGFPKLYREDARYYSILKDGEKAGIYGIIDTGGFPFPVLCLWLLFNS